MPRMPRAAKVEEVPLWLEVNGELIAQWSGTPVGLEALGAGRLLSLGFLRDPAELEGMQIVHDAPAGTAGIRARLRENALARGMARERERRDSRSGAAGAVERAGARHAAPPFPTLGALLRQLYEQAETERGESGGMHAAALSDGGALLFMNVDVSRHNTVERALGAALLAGEDLGAWGVVTTARISGGIASAAAAAGVAWVASRSVATTLAVAVAGAGGVRLVGRAASDSPIVYPS
jgi:FdhD protein